MIGPLHHPSFPEAIHGALRSTTERRGGKVDDYICTHIRSLWKKEEGRIEVRNIILVAFPHPDPCLEVK